MPIDLNRQEFRRLIERKFLPYVIKPARFLATEWRSGAVRCQAPLAVIVSGASYESSLTNPLSSAVAEALIESQVCDVGWLYQFGDQASERLTSIGAEPFVTPQLTQVTSAEMIIVPLTGVSDIFAALKNMIRAGLEFGDKQRINLIAVTESGKCQEALQQDVFADVFDQVFALGDFHCALENMRNSGASLSDSLKSKTRSQTRRLYFPQISPGPIIEISQNRACFRFSDSSTMQEHEASVGEHIGQAVLDSGQTEFQLENCQSASASLQFSDLLSQISAELTAERYRVTLSDLSPKQIGGFLPGALRRYRRAKVDIKLPSLSVSANSSLGRCFELSSLIESIKSLQRQENIQVQLTACLGFPGESDIELEETIDTLKTLSQALNPRSGLKVRFVHFTPHSSGADSDTAVRNMQEVEELFESIRRKKSRGISLTLLDSAPDVLDVLLERGAFTSRASLTEFALEFQNSGRRDTSATADMLRPYQSYLSGQSLLTKTSQADPARDIQPFVSGPVTDPAPDFNSRSADNGGVFGRIRKRSGSAGVAAPTKTRVRFTWTVSSHARYLSHLDNLRALEGALLRSRLPLSYTQGARPRPKVSFGPPLPVGFSSNCELFDAFFEVEPTSEQIRRLCDSLPPGLAIIRHETVYTKALSILEEVTAADYLVSLPSQQPREALSNKLDSALGSSRLVFQRTTKKGLKQIDLRPGLFAAEMLAGAEEARLMLTLALTDIFTIRPEDFLQTAGIIESSQIPELSVQRLKFHFGRMAAFRRPLVNTTAPQVAENSVSEEA